MKLELRRRTVLRAGALALAIPLAYSANAQIAVSTAINRTGRRNDLTELYDGALKDLLGTA